MNKKRKTRIERMMRLGAVLAATNSAIEANDNTATVKVARPVFLWHDSKFVGAR